ncbi:MAG: ABC transporter ATP-binding protein [Phycisphaerae bacterium]|jgi:lipopolysaccharide transport system ATP-binding protein
MSTAVFADRVSKEYRLGQLHEVRHMRDALVNWIRRPFARRQSNVETIWALDGVSFEIEEGEVVGIIGRNGAGKSTLLKVLSKITFPTSGVVKVQGRVASLLEVGTGFHEELTGRENIYLNGSILGMKKREIDKKLDAIVDFADVVQFLDTPIKRYSSGMRLRLGFAVAAHLEPDVLMVDEVLAVGDQGFQKKCLKAMDGLQAGGRTVLFVSHNLTAVENLCPRAIWIDGGRIRRDGNARDVIQEYLTTFAGEKRSGADLRDLSQRRGTGEARYTRLELLDADGNPSPVVRSGDSLTFRLHYEAHKRVQQPHFGVEIYTNLGTLVTSVNTWTSGFNLESIPPGEGYMDVHVEAANFVPDRYYLTMWLASVGTKYDHLDLCATLDIEPADVQKSGRKLEKYFGIVFLPCHWEHGGQKPLDHYVSSTGRETSS